MKFMFSYLAFQIVLDPSSFSLATGQDCADRSHLWMARIAPLSTEVRVPMLNLREVRAVFVTNAKSDWVPRSERMCDYNVGGEGGCCLHGHHI